MSLNSIIFQLETIKKHTSLLFMFPAEHSSSKFLRASPVMQSIKDTRIVTRSKCLLNDSCVNVKETQKCNELLPSPVRPDIESFIHCDTMN
jgi:hypothetical protein